MINTNSQLQPNPRGHPPSQADIEQLMNLADSMAAAAVSFTSHGYDAFIHSRQQFIDKLNELK